MHGTPHSQILYGSLLQFFIVLYGSLLKKEDQQPYGCGKSLLVKKVVKIGKKVFINKCNFKNKGRIFIQKQTVKKSLNLLLKLIK